MAIKPHLSISLMVSAVLGVSAQSQANITSWLEPEPNDANASNRAAAVQNNEDNQLESLLSAPIVSPVENDAKSLSTYGDLWQRLRSNMQMVIPADNSRIQDQVAWFAQRQTYINNLSARASRYLYHTVTTAEARNLPVELALLPIIESSYDPTATSRAAAAGMWQFIPSTGTMFGLDITSQYDGRRDVIESTRAAYDFLQSLYQRFNSWELALAAYNAGPSRVQQAINKNSKLGLPTDFWSLDLPKETKDYVPRFLAVASIIKAPDLYAVTLPLIANKPHFREVGISQSGIELQEIANILAIDRNQLYQLNSGLKGGQTTSDGPMRLLVPVNTPAKADIAINKLTPKAPPVQLAMTSKPVLIDLRPRLPSSSQGLATLASNAEAPSNSDYMQLIVTKPSNPGNETSARNMDKEKALLAGVIPAAITEQSTPKHKPISGAGKQSALPVASTPLPDSGNLPPATLSIGKALQEYKSGGIIQPTNLASAQEADVLDGVVKLADLQTKGSVLLDLGQSDEIQYDKPISANPIASNGLPDWVNKPSKANRIVYKVIAGDNLTSIAHKYNSDVNHLALWNQIPTDKPLWVGTALYIYGQNGKPIAAKWQTSNTIEQVTAHVVKSGETLIMIAKTYNLSLSKIAEYNNLSTQHRVWVGQKLQLTDIKAQATGSNKAKTSKEKTHIVKKGENLSLIAQKYNLDLNTLAEHNHLKSKSTLRAGQTLKIPSTTGDNSYTKQEEPKTYTAQPGDTLTYVASKQQISIDDLAKWNDLQANSELQIGQVLHVNAPGNARKQSTSRNEKASNLTVVSGDNLTTLANRYNVDISDLAQWNDLTTRSELQVGQKLRLTANGKIEKAGKTDTSSKKSSGKTKWQRYTVKAGDGLIKLAAKHSIERDALADKNGLSGKDELRIGQKIWVPKP